MNARKLSGSHRIAGGLAKVLPFLFLLLDVNCHAAPTDDDGAVANHQHDLQRVIVFSPTESAEQLLDEAPQGSMRLRRVLPFECKAARGAFAADISSEAAGFFAARGATVARDQIVSTFSHALDASVEAARSHRLPLPW